jgi:hypothetical protein
MRMRAFFSIATELFGYGPHSSRITFRREYARILTHKIFKSAAYGNYDLLVLRHVGQSHPSGIPVVNEHGR